MPPTWTTYAESPFPWERDALDFVRERFPDHEPYRAWSLFEFVARDGSVNEVDLLIYAPFGFFLVEIKSRPGRLTGDAGTWTWATDGRLVTTDNPLKATNLKAKKLADLLAAQPAAQSGGKRGGRIPFIEPLVFLSAPGLQCDLAGTGRLRVCLRDRDAADGHPARPGIMAAIKRRECPGLEALPGRNQLDRPTAKLVARALEQAGVRQSNRQRRVSDYVLDHPIDEGKNYQDWQASHAQLTETKRRIRVYPVRLDASDESRRTHERAAIREYQLIESLQSPGILRAVQYTGHELGPAVIFEHDPLAVRLDHFLSQRDRDLTLSTRLDLVRQLAEVMGYAHKKRVVHRALSPRSILVHDATSEKPRLKVFNWQSGYRWAATGPAGSSTGSAVTATAHVGMLVDDPTTAYMAPEVFASIDSLGENLDVFSLGAVAYHILSGKPPAADGAELSATLRASRGLNLAAVLDGASAPLCELVQFATHPDVSHRLDSVADFLDLLDAAEEHLTSPADDYAANPAEAVAGDQLPGGLIVERRIGQGSSSTALLVSRAVPGAEPEPADGGPPSREEFILKVASSPDHNDRLRAEAAVLLRLADDRDPRIVGFQEAVELGGHSGFLMRPVFADSEQKRIETLGARIRKEGRLHIELLERLGGDLIDVVRHLEKTGVAHRDIKPDNIAVGFATREHVLQIVLFDFSLTSVPPENIRAGTIGYLDPMLPERRQPRFDSYAERYAVAATLHEMATGTLPRWGDGRSDPYQIDAEITIDADLFDTDLREQLARFFTRAFRRDIALRFDNAEQMLAEWRACFAGIRSSPITEAHEGAAELRRLLVPATLDTPVAALGLGTRATNALDRANVLTVHHLLAFNRSKLDRMRGVGAKTRREITTAVDILRERLPPPGTSLGNAPPLPATVIPTDTTLDAAGASAIPAEALPIDAIAARLLAKPRGARAETGVRVAEILLGRTADPAAVPADPAAAPADPWPTQSAIAQALDLTRARIGQLYGKLLAKAIKDPAVTSVRDKLVEWLDTQGGAATADELAEWLASARPGDLPADAARRTAIGLVRIAVDAEGSLADPRLAARRDGRVMIVARSDDLADYAVRLGRSADRLAAAEPLTPPATVVDRLRAVAHPAGGTIESDSRLIRLAAAASQQAAISSRMELYPRGMDPLRALKLSLGAVAGAPELTGEQIRERVASRYPLSSPLPARPALDDLLRSAGLPLAFDPAAAGGRGAFVAPGQQRPEMTTGSTLLPRFQTAVGTVSQPAATPEVADARAFEDRLHRARQNGSFLQLVVRPREYERTAGELCRRFGVVRIDVEEAVIDALRETAAALDIDWTLVVAADADPSAPDWHNLRQLVDHTQPRIAARLCRPGEVLLLLYADILVRYGLRPLLADLQQRIGTATGPGGVWLLVPGGSVVQLDNQPVGVPGPQAVVPDAWLENLHRAGRGAPVPA